MAGADLSRASKQENVSTTLSAGITDVSSSMDVSDASKMNYPSYLVIDRVDSAGTVKNTSLWEYVKVTNISSNTLTITRAQGGSTAQAHSSGAVVEAVMTAALQEEYYAAFNPEHTATGGHIMSSATIATVVNTTLVGSAIMASNVTVTNFLNLSGASIIGLGLNPTWYIPSLTSAATTSLGRPMAVPREGSLKFVNITLSANISQPSALFDVNKNFTSVFAPACRPMIAGGTFVSTASIATKVFKAGDVFSIDLDNGGNAVDATVTLAGQ